MVQTKKWHSLISPASLLLPGAAACARAPQPRPRERRIKSPRKPMSPNRNRTVLLEAYTTEAAVWSCLCDDG
ncbi:hypothetical protein H4582DRAFT_1982746 [Lactarius indigo]|nr:hypothetical protein H4582DRAFT_1982746 [Lactarius indigo]